MAPWIYINGHPGVGKFTLAKELERLIPNSEVWDNGIFIDPVNAAINRMSPHYYHTRTHFRRFILDYLSNAEEKKDTTLIFTDSRFTSETGRQAVSDYQLAALHRGAPFISIVLACKSSENLRRFLSPGHPKRSMKWLDLELVQDIQRGGKILQLGNKKELRLVTTEMSPELTADVVWKHVKTVASIREAEDDDIDMDLEATVLLNWRATVELMRARNHSSR